MNRREEIENLLKEISNGFRKIPQVENILYPLDMNQFQILSEYIEHLESREPKLIEKLLEDKKQLMEELKYNITKREARLQLQLVGKYLKILKGEKDE